VFAPEDVMNDAHFRARGFPVDVRHEDLGRTFTYPGAAVRLNGSPMTVRGRAPHIGEHTAEVIGSLRN
jgi:crotonobetainyl-CoA:carnitine CoA-transferase CaiB-like acyl-CoA transferase